jgi:hypothetical protein
LAPKDVEPALAIALSAIGGGRELIEGWVASGELTPMTSKAVESAPGGDS